MLVGKEPANRRDKGYREEKWQVKWDSGGRRKYVLENRWKAWSWVTGWVYEVGRKAERKCPSINLDFFTLKKDSDFLTLPSSKATHYNLASSQTSPTKLPLEGSPMPPLPHCQHQGPIWPCCRHLTTICSLLKLSFPLTSTTSCFSCYATNTPRFGGGREVLYWFWLFLPLLPTGPLNDGIPQGSIFYFIRLYKSCFPWVSQCTALARCQETSKSYCQPIKLNGYELCPYADDFQISISSPWSVCLKHQCAYFQPSPGFSLKAL